MSVKNGFFFLNAEFFSVKNCVGNFGRDENVDNFATTLANEMTMRLGVAVVVHLVVARVYGSDVVVHGKLGKVAIDRSQTEMWIFSVQAVVNHIGSWMSFDTFYRLKN